MPLMSCPVCQRQVSTAAEACPQCGHPLQEKRRDPNAMRCYGCDSDATTRCQSCGVASCVRHVESIYVSHGRGGSYELRCSSCYSSAAAWKIIGWVFGAIVLAIVFLIWSGMMR